MTFSQLKESVLVKGDESTYSWNEPWRRHLVDNLEFLVKQLWDAGIEEVYIGGSFCTDAPQPGDLDAYFVLDIGDVNDRDIAIDCIFDGQYKAS
ncbi:hypothetical protein H1R82_03345 [Thermoactinomyces intermedius]|jgi:hypothetical protein|uniref:Uncharacterized protein n=2 Tax=Thermoactinomyces intermedius TaxID=2024 RepID=A0A8I1AGE9_THEIN|nr:hypothetical protein [Thermoactinomyces intermedius]MBA4549109.1 hypothetical protein [Thermoactinomyces intermedius]MBA4835670.1 hypothetical protein [Thermoactinomyces intermedius]MBH8595518.1 hypothetical protein [Thermoactinomyces intermedius]